MKCENCGNEHDGSYGSGRFCSVECKNQFCGNQSLGGKIERRYKCEKLCSPHGTWKCKVCGEILGTRRELAAHMENNHSTLRGVPWNKGMTKETSELVRHNGESVSKAMKNSLTKGNLMLTRRGRQNEGKCRLNSRKNCIKNTLRSIQTERLPIIGER